MKSFADAFVTTNDEKANYRVYLSPLDPSETYSVKNGKLKFSYSAITHSSHQYGVSIQQITTNLFNIKAAFASTFETLKNQLKARNSAAKTSLVVDLDQKYFDENTVETVTDYSYLPNKGFFAVKNARSGLTTAQPQLFAPVYSQTIHTYVIPDYGITSVMPRESKTELENPLHANNNSHSEIYDYKKNAFGKDILLPDDAPVKTVAYCRTINRVSEWYSHTQDINRKSYPELTQNITDESNAAGIAELFLDYSKKGHGFSKWIHFHIWRHADNVQKAKQIVHDLHGDKYKSASNLEIANYLAEQYEAARTTHKDFNENGSFARRISYAILQLTQGLCASVDEFRKLQPQLEFRKMTSS